MLSKRRYRRTMNKYACAKYKEKMRTLKKEEFYRDVFRPKQRMINDTMSYNGWYILAILLGILLWLF